MPIASVLLQSPGLGIKVPATSRADQGDLHAETDHPAPLGANPTPLKVLSAYCSLGVLCVGFSVWIM